MDGELNKGELREQAKKRLEGKRPVEQRSADDNVKLVEELSIHQEELNIQNEELLRSQIELGASRAKYFQLYDLAPVGYITLTPALFIKESNLATATLLGTERKSLINKSLSSFVSPRSQESLYLHYRRLSIGNEKQVHTFSVQRKDGKELQIQFESNVVEGESGKGFRSILTDVTELRRTEEALRESEKRFRTLSEATFEGIVVHANNIILDVNQAVLDQTGYAREEVIGRSIMEFFSPESQAIIREGLRKPVIEAYEAQLIRKDGEQRTVQIKGRAMEFEGRTAWVTTIMDVTERKKVQKAAEGVSALLESIISNSPEGIVVFDGRELRVKVMNAYYNQHFLDEPFRDRDLIGKRIEEFIPDVEKTPVPELLRNVARTGVPFIVDEYEFQGFRRGSTYWNMAYVPIGQEGQRDILVTAIEVTHQVEARKRIEEEKVRLRAVLDTLPVGVFIADASGRMVEMNDAVKQIWGEDAPLVDSIDRYIDYKGWRPDTDERYKAEDWPLARALQKGESIVGEVIDIERFDGGRATILNSAAPIRDQDGRVLGAVVAAQDITELKRTEEDLRRSNTELQQFAYVASHDLQEPLRMVTAYIGLLNKKYGNELNDQAKSYMAFAVDGANRMKDLIGDLLQYSRIDTQGKSFSSVDLNLVTEEVIDTLHVAIRESKAVVTKEPLPTVWGDATQLSQVLQNLISNAVKFRGPQAPRIEVASRESAREWTIMVKDNGIGIDPKDHDKLFQMFQRLHTRTEYQGTGIGLAIAKKIVELHGGRIWVKSDGRSGSTFYFTIPIQS